MYEEMCSFITLNNIQLLTIDYWSIEYDVISTREYQYWPRWYGLDWKHFWPNEKPFIYRSYNNLNYRPGTGLGGGILTPAPGTYETVWVGNTEVTELASTVVTCSFWNKMHTKYKYDHMDRLSF